MSAVAGIVETPHVADFGDDPCRNRKRDAAQCLERLDDGTKRPFRHERLDLLLDEIAYSNPCTSRRLQARGLNAALMATNSVHRVRAQSPLHAR